MRLKSVFICMFILVFLTMTSMTAYTDAHVMQSSNEIGTRGR